MQSDQIAIREWATQMLIDGGSQVIDPLAESIAKVDLESTIRGLEILRSLALEELATASLAETAIRKIADNRVASSSARANEVLRSIVAMRTQRAERILSRQGVGFSVTPVSTGSYTYAASLVRTVTFGESWSGTVDDLVFLSWLADERGISVEAAGDRITDEWLRRVAKVDNIVGLKLGRSSVTDEGMSALREMPRLLDIRIYYCDISNAWLKHIDHDESNLKSISVFGSRMTEDAIKKLERTHPDLTTRYGLGGFLGIRGEENPVGEGCLVTDVTPNAAASKADIRKNDIIIEYDGHVVSEFMPAEFRIQRLTPVIPIERNPDDTDRTRALSLSELIGQNRAGERVEVKIKRLDRILTKEVELGEWQ